VNSAGTEHGPLRARRNDRVATRTQPERVIGAAISKPNAVVDGSRARISPRYKTEASNFVHERLRFRIFRPNFDRISGGPSVETGNRRTSCLGLDFNTTPVFRSDPHDRWVRRVYSARAKSDTFGHGDRTRRIPNRPAPSIWDNELKVRLADPGRPVRGNGSAGP